MGRRCVAEIIMTSFFWVTAAAATAVTTTTTITTAATATIIKEPGVVRSVWVVRGGRADLPCAPSPKHDKDSARLVLWYRSSQTLPVYSYDARDGEFTSGVRWADEGVLGGRANFLPTSEPPTLVLEPAHSPDQGIYTCRVDYRISPSTTAYVNLTVVSTHWVEAVVAIVGSRELLGSTLSCHARTPTHGHTDLVQQQTASVVVNVTLAPVEVRILGSGSAVTAGTTMRLVCRAAGSHPPAHLTWWRGHSRLPQVIYAIEAGGNVTTATLTMKLERTHNGVTLACTASNPALPRAQHLTDTVKLNVFYPPVVHLSLGRPLDPESIKEGDDVYFECSIVSNPPYQRVDWHHDGALVVHNVTSGVVVSGLSLVLRRLSREHSGSYTCGAHNIEGYNISNPVTLSVRHSPICAGDKRERTQGAARGSTAAVKCTVEAEPDHDLNWTWIRKRADGSDEEVPQEDVRSEGLTSSVFLTPNTPDDYGRFLCLAENVVGRQRAACVVNLVPAGPPDTPTNCSVAPADSSTHIHTHTASLAITCIEGFDGGLPQHFTLETWQDGSLAANMSSMFPEWVVTGLRAGVGVTLRVAAHNARGKSDVIRFEVHTASAQQHAAPDSEWGLLGVPPLLGAIVGVGGVLLIILVTGVIIAKYTWRAQPPTHVHTLVMTPTTRQDSDTYDPDVVSSLRRNADNLDVLPTTQKSTSTKSHAHKQTVIRTHAQGQSVTRAYVNRHGNKHPSITRGFCLHRQDSPFPDTDSDDSEDSDSDSTFTDLTAAGRAAAALPPAGRYTHSLPRPLKRELRHVASSSLDLQLHSCQRSQVVASSNGVIQRVPCFTRNPRRPLPASSEELRHLTSSAEELHPLIFSGDLRHLLSSGDLRHLSFSGTELRMVPSTGTWPPLSSSSGEIRLPLPSSATLQSLTTEELRILPSSSSSSPWDVQGMPSFSQLPTSPQQLPSLPPCAEICPQLPYLEMQLQTPHTELHQRPSCGVQQLRETQIPCGELHPRLSVSAVQARPQCSDPLLMPCCTGPQQRQQCAELQQRSSFSDLYQRPPCSEHQPPPPITGHQPRPPCLKQKSLPSPLSYLELEPSVSLKELQPPQPCGEMQSLLPLVELQPPPSFRGPQLTELTIAETVNPCSLPQKNQAEMKPLFSQVNYQASISNEQITSFSAENDLQSVKYPTGVGTLSSPSKASHPLPTSSTTQKFVRFSGEKPDLSTDGIDRTSPSLRNDKLGFVGKFPESIPRPLTNTTTRPLLRSSHSFQDNQTQHTSNTGNKTHTRRKEPIEMGKQISFSDDERLQAPVVVRIPAKSGAGKSEKRCAQLFSNVDVSPSSVSKIQPLETTSGSETSCCPRAAATTACPLTFSTESHSPTKTILASKLSSGTPEKKKVHREVSTPPKPPRGSPQFSPVTSEEPRPLATSVDQYDSHGDADSSVGFEESVRSVAAKTPQISLKSTALEERLEPRGQ